MANCSVACLHCAISNILMERERLGLAITPHEIGKMCQVIADIAASQPVLPAQLQIISVAVGFLTKFGGEIAGGQYGSSEIVDPNNNRGRRF